MLMRAQKKFDKLDADGNGLLEGDELVELAEWVWSSFHPGGDALSEEEKAAESSKLLGRLDANDDGCMSFDEFVDGSGGRVQRLSGTGEGWHRLMLQDERLVLWSSCVTSSQLHHLVEVETGDVGLAMWWTRWW